MELLCVSSEPALLRLTLAKRTWERSKIRIFVQTALVIVTHYCQRVNKPPKTHLILDVEVVTDYNMGKSKAMFIYERAFLYIYLFKRINNKGFQPCYCHETETFSERNTRNLESSHLVPCVTPSNLRQST